MQLAKQALDVGLYTNQLEEQLDFWQNQAGLPFDEMLPVGGGVRQHRHRIGESIFKLNHSRDPLPAAPTTIQQISLATAQVHAETNHSDPDGNSLRLVPEGGNITQMRVHLSVADLVASRNFYRDALQLEELSQNVFVCGVTQLELSQGKPTDEGPNRALGYRYLTVQVFDVRHEHAGILARGGREGMAPVKLGEVAHISFVRDPDGTWIEISQRKSLTGSLD